MDINKTIGELNSAPDAYLDQVVASKGPMSPFALVVQSQRQQMRAGAQGAPQGVQPTVAQQVTQQRAGLSGLPQQAPAEPQNPMQQGLGAQHLARGGVVGYDDGGDVEAPPMSYADQMRALAGVPMRVLKTLVSAPGYNDAPAASKASSKGLASIGSGTPSMPNGGAADIPAMPATPAMPAQAAAAPLQDIADQNPDAYYNPKSWVSREAQSDSARVLLSEMSKIDAELATEKDPTKQSDLVKLRDGVKRELQRLNGASVRIPGNGGDTQTARSTTNSGTKTTQPSAQGLAALPAMPPTAASAPQPPSELDQKNQATLLALANQTIPDMTDEQAAAKVKARRDLYGIPALIQGQTDNATRFQDSQDAAVAAKRAVMDKANSSGEGTRAMLNGMLQAIDARKPNQHSNLLGGAATGYEGFRNASLARTADQVSQEDTQRKQRFDMEQQLQNARILYAQGNEAEAAGLVQAVVSRQDALRKAQESAAVQGATNATTRDIAAATNTTNVGIHSLNNDTSRYVADKNAESRLGVADIRTGAAGDKDPQLIAAFNKAAALVKDLAAEKAKAGIMLQGADLAAWQQKKAAADADYLKYQKMLVPESGGVQEPTQAPALDLQKWGSPTIKTK
jgi:hypothetical protein